MASTSTPPTCSLALAGTPVSTEAATSKRSLAVSFSTDVVASPSASKRLATDVAAPSNDDDHFMSAVTRAAVSSPLLDSRTAITTGQGPRTQRPPSDPSLCHRVALIKQAAVYHARVPV